MEWLEQLKITNIHIDWVAVISIAAIIVAIVAILAVIVVTKREKFIFGLKLLLELNDYFNSDTMLETRKKAASSLLSGSENLLDYV